MYWPLGAPRVFAASKARQLPLDDADEAEEDVRKDSPREDRMVRGLRVSRNGQVFATITATSLDLWQTSPVALITSVERSKASIQNYGHNVSVLLRPDCSIAAVQTSLGFMITWNVTVDPEARVYQLLRTDEKARRLSVASKLPVEEARRGHREIHIRFRMVIKIDAGISKALALEDELVVATERPAAVQCIRWAPDNTSSQTSTELLSRLPWMSKKSAVVDFVYDRAMSMFIWISNEGKAYAVQKIVHQNQKTEGQGKFFRGHTLHVPDEDAAFAKKAAINARFSLLAVGCANGTICVYMARDYAGSLPLSHKLQPPASLSTTGAITFMAYSPDGYCLFVGFEHGWVMWSVYGKLGGSSFTSDSAISKENDEVWLLGIGDGSWITGGSEIIFTSREDDRLWILELARSAVTGCFGPANISRTLLHTASNLMIYRGHDSSDVMSLSAEEALWNHVQIPASFLSTQRPIRCAVISPDGRYVAVAGRRGLAHYSVHSGRWKTFNDPEAENSFVVRGGMCWHQHVLIAAVDTGDHDEIRLYSRETGLDASSMVHMEPLQSPAVTIAPSGEDSILVYTYENNLYHYVIKTSDSVIQLVRVGQIGLHGIVRAPARVRAVTWHIPDHQLIDGDPSKDVVHASVMFLVDAKLVMLQPAKDESGSLKYDMRIIANDVEYFSFARDQSPYRNPVKMVSPFAEVGGRGKDEMQPAPELLDSLWYFDGQQVRCWPDMQDVIKSAATEGNRDLPRSIQIPVDFYPTSIALGKGVVIGVEPDLVQRRDFQFAFYRFSIRTQLFLPPILRHYLAISESTSALSICHHYQRLSYFSHALEVLLHTVLDDEVDSQPPRGQALLPSVLSFLSSFPDYLEVLVQCTRKTEVRSWHRLFETLPPPQELFDESLQKGHLKTAGGYLLVLNTFDETGSSSEQCIRLLQKARDAGDWDLCKELARFLVALDMSGDTLKSALQHLDLETPPTPLPQQQQRPNGLPFPKLRQLDIPRTRDAGEQQAPPDQRSPSSQVSTDGGSAAESSPSEYHSGKEQVQTQEIEQLQPGTQLL